MVLPASISEGLQGMIGAGSAANGASDLHLHFHGPSDGPAVERWFTGLLARNPGAVRNLLRSNALAPAHCRPTPAAKRPKNSPRRHGGHEADEARRHLRVLRAFVVFLRASRATTL
jgi:hypothetical protein